MKVTKQVRAVIELEPQDVSDLKVLLKVARYAIYEVKRMRTKDSDPFLASFHIDDLTAIELRVVSQILEL